MKCSSVFFETFCKIKKGDILAIEYTASVVGSSKPFAKSEQEKFVLKDGSMIKGWDIGVSSMKIGKIQSISPLHKCNTSADFL
jgi:FKBP-type peptidyl-prolyl cis-trans isomerase (trigger factor)